jgi:GrpB-like predicted nucleotidyltransferase (UPF0157 family)
MPPATVLLAPHDRAWAARAAQEAERLCAAAPRALKAVHHMGSTAVPGLAAKPVVDLLGVAFDLEALDRARGAIEALGYDALGEYGLTGRRYFRLDDAVSGERRVHLHCYQAQDSAIARHLAFRDLLRGDARLAAEYEREKRRCAARHPVDGAAYTACKGDWIRRTEASCGVQGPSPGQQA